MSSIRISGESEADLGRRSEKSVSTKTKPLKYKSNADDSDDEEQVQKPIKQASIEEGVAPKAARVKSEADYGLVTEESGWGESGVLDYGALNDMEAEEDDDDDEEGGTGSRWGDFKNFNFKNFMSLEFLKDPSGNFSHTKMTQAGASVFCFILLLSTCCCCFCCRTSIDSDDRLEPSDNKIGFVGAHSPDQINQAREAGLFELFCCNCCE